MEEMERKFGGFTLDELKKACEICLDDKKGCSDGCPMSKVDCGRGTNTSVLELIDVYKATRTMHQYWFTKAQELQGKADKFDAIRNELIRTQELLKEAQDKCRERADKIRFLRETIDAMDNDYHEQGAKLYNAELAQKRLETDITCLENQLNLKQTAIDRLIKEKAETHEEIDRLTKEKNEANEALLHYRTLMNSLHFIGEAMRGDQSGNHEKD